MQQFEFLTSFPTRGCKIYKTSPERYDEKEGYLAQVDAERGGVGTGKFLITFNPGRLCPEVQPLTISHTNLNQNVTPFTLYPVLISLCFFFVKL